MVEDNCVESEDRIMKKLNLLNSSVDDELQHYARLYAEAMIMVSSEFGSSLSHEEFMNKAEEYFCKLLEEGESHNLA